jgi:hypothetical protein
MMMPNLDTGKHVLSKTLGDLNIDSLIETWCIKKSNQNIVKQL